MQGDYQRVAERLKALAEPTRLKILKMLAIEEMCACEIIEKLHLSQPAVSHHLKILRQAQLIKDRKEGKWIFFCINEQEFSALVNSLQSDYLLKQVVVPKHEPSVPFPLE